MKKYIIIYNDIVKKINSDIFPVGSTLPSENTLANTYNSSRATVRSALNLLEQNGLILKQQGKETIVVNNENSAKTILLILPNLFKYIFKDLITAIEDELRTKGINLLIARSYNNQKIESDIIKKYMSAVDGIILEPTQAQYTKLLHSKNYSLLANMPTVCINSKLENFSVPFFIMDDYNSAKLLTEHIVSNSVKKVLILAKTDDLQGYDRLRGITDVLSQNPQINYHITEFTTYNEEQKLVDFSKSFYQFSPDCIMFYNDEYANSFLTQYNINPMTQNILITGFDNTEYSNGKPYFYISPAHPKEQMGRDAAKAIIRLLDGQQVESMVYPPDIDFNK